MVRWRSVAAGARAAEARTKMATGSGAGAAIHLPHAAGGFVEVRTPALVRKELWETSGHWAHYQDNMFVFDDHGHFPGFDDRPDFRPFILNPVTGQPVARQW